MTQLDSLKLAFAERLDFKRWTILFAVFCLIFSTQVPYIYLIYNLNDCFYYILNQELANQSGIFHIKSSPLWWLTDVIGGFWLRITESYGLWGIKIGGVAALALTGVISANTLFQIYKPTISIALVMTLTGFCLPVELLNWVSIPILLYSIFGFYFLKLHRDPLSNTNPIVCGLICLLMVFCRMTMIFTIFVIPSCLLACYLFQKKEFKLYLSAYLKVIGVFLSSAVLFILFLQYQGFLREYLFFPTPSKIHSSTALFRLLSSQLLNKIPVLTIISCFSFGLYLLIKRGALTGRKTLFTSIGLVGLYVLMIICGFKWPIIKNGLKILWPDGFDLFPILISLNIMFFLLLRKVITFQEVVLFILGIFWPLLRMVGSSMGLHQGIVISFLLCGLTFIMLLRVARLYECRLPLYCIGSAIILVMGIKAIRAPINLSRPPIIQIANSHYLKKLNRIFMQPDRAENLSSLVREIERYAKKEERILACPYIPIVYYSSSTLPLGDHPCLFFLDFDRFIAKLDQIAAMPPPPVIIKTKVAMDNPKQQELNFTWPIDPDFVNDLNRKISIFDQKILKGWNAKLAWSNEHYELYVPSNEGPSK